MEVATADGPAGSSAGFPQRWRDSWWQHWGKQLGWGVVGTGGVGRDQVCKTQELPPLEKEQVHLNGPHLQSRGGDLSKVP